MSVLLSGICLLSTIFLPDSASGFSQIKITFNPDFPIAERNLAPGDSILKNFSVDNGTDETVALSMKIASALSENPQNPLSKMIVLQIKRPDGSFAPMPGGNSFVTLFELYQKNSGSDPFFEFDALAGPTSVPAPYQLLATFSKDAGNEFQGLETRFDLSVNIRSEKFDPDSDLPVSRQNDEDDGDDDGDGNDDSDSDNGNDEVSPAGDGPVDSFQILGPAILSDISEPSLGGGLQENTAEAKVAGATDSKGNCKNIFGKELWIFLLAVYNLLVVFNLFQGFKQQLKPRWAVEALLTASALGAWIFLDSCFAFSWFPLAILLSGFAIYSAYLTLLTRKIALDV